MGGAWVQSHTWEKCSEAEERVSVQEKWCVCVCVCRGTPAGLRLSALTLAASCMAPLKGLLLDADTPQPQAEGGAAQGAPVCAQGGRRCPVAAGFLRLGQPLAMLIPPDKGRHPSWNLFLNIG